MREPMPKDFCAVTGVDLPQRETKLREWTLFDNDEYGPAWNGPRFEPTQQGIHVVELPPDAIVITREMLREAISRARTDYDGRLASPRIDGEDLEEIIFGEAE